MPSEKYGIPAHLRSRQILGRGKRRAVLLVGHNRALKVEMNPTAHGKSPNELEWANFQRYFQNAPASLRQHIAPISRRKIKDGHVMHQIRLVKDFNGSISRTIEATGKIANAHFWKSFQRMVDELVRAHIPFYDFSSKNILVKRVSPTNWIPVLVDYESMGPHSARWQFWLRSKYFSGLKVRRRAERLQKQFSERA